MTISAGKYGIGKRFLEKVQKPIDLFDILREKDLLNEMNIITLQAMLWTLPRRDLQKKYVEFAESIGSSIHFIVPRDTPGKFTLHLFHFCLCRSLSRFLSLIACYHLHYRKWIQVLEVSCYGS